MNKEELMKILPHREPMLLVDEAYVNEDGTATAYYHVRGDEFFLQGHFPGNPIVPGVIQCEIMAQASCVLFEKEMTEGKKIPVYTGLNKVKFKNRVVPGDTIEINTKLIRALHPMYVLEGTLSVNGKVCTTGEFSFAIVDGGQ